MTSDELLATCVLGGAAIAIACWAILAWRKTHYTFAQAFLYLVNTFVTRVLWRTTISGRLPVAPGQGAVIVSNHRAGIDPLLIQLTTDRVVHWMVAREYVEHPAMAWAFRILRSIPVNRRGIDTASTKQAIRLAKQGDLVGNFPEGRVNVTERLLLPGRPGAALIALKARVPVVPCYIEGAPYDGTALGSFLMPAKAHVTIGPLIDISDYYGREGEKGVLDELTKRFLTEIGRLAGQEFEPEVAGKHWRHEPAPEAEVSGV